MANLLVRARRLRRCVRQVRGQSPNLQRLVELMAELFSGATCTISRGGRILAKSDSPAAAAGAGGEALVLVPMQGGQGLCSLVLEQATENFSEADVTLARYAALLVGAELLRAGESASWLGRRDPMQATSGSDELATAVMLEVVRRSAHRRAPVRLRLEDVRQTLAAAEAAKDLHEPWILRRFLDWLQELGRTREETDLLLTVIAEMAGQDGRVAALIDQEPRVRPASATGHEIPPSTGLRAVLDVYDTLRHSRVRPFPGKRN